LDSLFPSDSDVIVDLGLPTFLAPWFRLGA